MVAESKESYVVSASVYSIALIMMRDIKLPVADQGIRLCCSPYIFGKDIFK